MLSTSAVKWKGNSQSERNKSIPPTDPVQHLPQTQPRFTSCVLICNRGRLVSHTYFYRTINKYQSLSPWQRTDSLMFHWCFSHDPGSLCSGLRHLFKHHQLQQQLRMHYFLFKMFFFSAQNLSSEVGSLDFVVKHQNNLYWHSVVELMFLEFALVWKLLQETFPTCVNLEFSLDLHWVPWTFPLFSVLINPMSAVKQILYCWQRQTTS